MTGGKSQFGAPFFGLIGNNPLEVNEDGAGYIKQVFEQLFQINYFGDLSLTEAYNLPVGLRRWWYNRLKEQKEKEQKEAEKQKNKQAGKRKGTL